jgi:Protein of unknown function (DUF2844)
MPMKNLVLPCLLIAALLPCVASATLGEPLASIQTDGSQLRGSIKATEHAGYTLHEIALPSGTTLREYAGPGGNVFAVAWSGPAAPNLRQLMGKYFDVYVAAPKSSVTDKKHLSIQQDDLVMEASAHMRTFSGRAYLPPSIPAGVNLGDIR